MRSHSLFSIKHSRPSPRTLVREVAILLPELLRSHGCSDWNLATSLRRPSRAPSMMSTTGRAYTRRPSLSSGYLKEAWAMSGGQIAHLRPSCHWTVTT